MKHVYYGVKKQSNLHIDDFRLASLKTYCREYKNYYRSKIEREIENLKNNEHSPYITIEYVTIDNEVFITEENHEHILEISDEVEIGKHKGRVVYRRYDPVNDTMYYYTNIIVLQVETENFSKQLEEARSFVLNELERLYEEYFKEDKKDKKGKNLWKKLFE